jgi:hypothetical protein
VNLIVNEPQAFFTTLAGSKLGSQRPPVVCTTSVIVAVSPLYVPTPPNHACSVPSGLNENQNASMRFPGSTSTIRPCPLCAGSYHAPVKLASIRTAGV